MRDARGHFLPGDGHKASGAGHGGPAKGPGLWGGREDLPKAPQFTSDVQPPGEHKSEGKRRRQEFREKLAAKLDKVDAVYDAALADPDLRVGLVAAKQISVELWGQPTQEISGPEGGPLASLAVTFVKPRDD